MKLEAIIIKDEVRDNLQMSWDEEDGFVFLFTPDMKNTDNHYHMELTENAATQLSLFLNRKLEELRNTWESFYEIQQFPRIYGIASYSFVC